MRNAMTLVCLLFAACMLPPSQSVQPSGAPAAAIPATGAPAAPRAAGLRGQAAVDADQYYSSHIRTLMDGGQAQPHPSDRIEGISCSRDGAAVQHVAWCQDDRTAIVCEGNQFVQIDCGKLSPPAACGLDGRGQVDCAAE